MGRLHRVRLARRQRIIGGAVVGVLPETSLGQPAIVWPAANPPVSLDPGVVHVWGWRLDTALAGGFAETPGLLSPDELARAERFVSSIHRDRFVQAHAGLRLILSSYLAGDPAAITFALGEHGKPRLKSHTGVHFNLSHAHDIALLAVSDVEVGVDVEFVHPVDEGIAERFFSRAEATALAALPEAERLAGFYAFWTRKEAFLKGVGTGISGGLDSFTVNLPGQGAPKLSDSGSGITEGWRLEHLEPAAGYVGAVAVQARNISVRCFSWNPLAPIGS